MRKGDVWGTGLAGWKWAEVFGLLAVFAAVDLERDFFDARPWRLSAGLVALGLLSHITIWMVAELRRRL